MNQNAFPSDLPTVVQRFLRYVQIDTTSDPDSSTVPSTEKQKNLSELLVQELRDMGYNDAHMDQFGYVFCSVEAVPGDGLIEPRATVALVAHVDTSPDAPGGGVRPIIHPPYDGSVIELPGNPQVKLDPATSPALLDHVNERIISSDGTTLLGSDDKAGVAVIMELAARFRTDTRPRPALRLCFTIDEEIGRGVDHLDLEQLGADVAYTIDGSSVDTLSFETFNAAVARITVHGKSVHPGYAKGVLLNASRILSELISQLPADEAPETTDGIDGYYHPHRISESDVSKASCDILLRDFSSESMKRRKVFVQDLAASVASNYPGARISVEIQDSYVNMRSWIEKIDFRTVEFARFAAQRMGFELREERVRGGTDGARLSEAGLPCPNVFNGGYDYHSCFEWNTVENLERSLEYVHELVTVWGEQGFSAPQNSLSWQETDGHKE